MTETSKATIAAVVDMLNARRDQWAPDEQCREAASLISALEAERDALRTQVALANDPAYLATAIDKVGMVDKEWKARAEAAESHVAALQAKLEKAAEERDEWLRFIARWAWDKTGPADERLSVIQYFPPVKAARPEPLSTLRETTNEPT